MTLSDRAREAADAEGDLEADRRAASLRRERDTYKRAVTSLEEELERARELLTFHDAVVAADPTPPQWLAPAKPKAGNHVQLVAMLSDTHFDEVVDPARVGGVNAYDRDIATLRLKRWAERLIMLGRDYTTGATIDGLIVALGGDIFSGDIHEELRRTNADTMLGSVLFWSEQIAAAIDVLADEYGKVHCPSTFGNHGRTTEKPLLNMEARTNFDWFLSNQLARLFAGDKRVTFDVPEARDTYFTCYGTTVCLNHGNETSGGGGIGGIWPPLMRMKAKKAERDAALGRRWNTLLLGHWHQEVFAPQQGLIVNPSMKGYDTFAGKFNFRPERPAQLTFVVTPEHGITDGRPVICADRRKEKW